MCVCQFGRRISLILNIEDAFIEILIDGIEKNIEKERKLLGESQRVSKFQRHLVEVSQQIAPSPTITHRLEANKRFDTTLTYL
jgi:hypothetical protein